jgi:hypothetical protein
LYDRRFVEGAGLQGAGGVKAYEARVATGDFSDGVSAGKGAFADHAAGEKPDFTGSVAGKAPLHIFLACIAAGFQVAVGVKGDVGIGAADGRIDRKGGSGLRKYEQHGQQKGRFHDSLLVMVFKKTDRWETVPDQLPFVFIISCHHDNAKPQA